MFSVQHPMHVISTFEIINTGIRQQYWTRSYLQLHDCISTKYSLMQWSTDACVHFFFMRYFLNLTFHSMSFA